MAPQYNPRDIEPKWQKCWLDTHAFVASDDNVTKQKFYCLDMFPYPSAAGLHVGHPEGYTATDIFSRYKRMKGLNVLHPMGWDAFGLPAENYAIKTGVDPDTSTHQNIKNFTRQIQALGFSYDWEREIDTSSPEYYRWTQWIFLQLYHAGLAYRKKAKVNWCESCQTVLANEQVIDGNCERSNDPVAQKELEQWFFKITEYADQLLDDLDGLDWPEPIQRMQRHWIGRKDGVVITHAVKEVSLSLDAFSAYPAWLFADTFLVIAPEHPIVPALVRGTAAETDVMRFVEDVRKTPTAERGAADKEKKGINTGRIAIDPFSGAEMPIWLANFALMDFGTGIIRCSAHDVRDYAFAQQYGIVVKEVVARTGEEPINAHENAGVLQDSGVFSGRNITPDLIEEMIQWIEAQGFGKRTRTYRLRDWLISRQRYWGAPIPIVYAPDGTPHAVKEEHLPLQLPTDVDFRPKGTSPLGSSAAYKQLAEKLYGAGWHFEFDTMDTFVCSSWYYLRYCDPQNTRVFAAPETLEQWLPVDLYVGGAEHAVLHLLYARFFHKALQDMNHIPASVGREPFTSLRNQGIILGPDHQKMSKSRGNVINPDEVVDASGADTLRMYEMFMGPFEDMKPWSTESIKGIRRFLERAWNVVMDARTAPDTPGISRNIHATVKKVTEDIEGFRFNTAISAMMIFVNKKDFVSDAGADHAALRSFLQILFPFAPHIAEELWEQMGQSFSIGQSAWPTYDASKIVEAMREIGVQVNGKMRGTIQLAVAATEAEARAAAAASSSISKYITGKEIAKCVYVPGRILNLIVR